MPRSTTILSLASSLILAPAALADVVSFRLSDHPRGEAVPPEYGLRLDDLFGPSSFPVTFSFNDGGASVRMDVDVTAKTIHIYGTVFGGVDGGNAYVAPELFDLDMFYKFGVVGEPVNGWDVQALGNTGSITRQSDSTRWDLTTKLNGFGNAFEFHPDRYRLYPGDLPNVSWVGRGWLDTAANPRPTRTRDFLFVATVVPLPAGVLAGSVGLGCVGLLALARRRRSHQA
jgi:hypothetical protein